MSVIAGSPHEPMTRAIAEDLERRGFIVYVVVQSAEEEHTIQMQNRSDIRALHLDLTIVSRSLLGSDVHTNTNRHPRHHPKSILRYTAYILSFRNRNLRRPVSSLIHAS
jgi:hypothetical protein